MNRGLPQRLVGAVCILFLAGGLGRADELSYSAPDPALQAIRLDSAATESFLSVRADSVGRLFVGGRECLFVYEPSEGGGLKPRQFLYKFPAHTWVNDIAIRGDDLYVVTVSALYRLAGAVTRRQGIQAKRLLWGVPRGHVHQCFHALTWGPEGDLYLSMGDPEPNFGDFSRADHWGYWTFHCGPDGQQKVPYSGVGAVFRCRPDGTKLRIVATGLRNACGLTVDHDWNFFTNDNDHESMPAEYVPGRLLHITPGAYFSWPRGWMPEKQPGRADLLQTMFTGMGRAVPVGMTYYDDAYLPEQYRNNLLLARWCTRQVTCYPIARRGASFKAEAEHVLLQGNDQARPVGVCAGRAGRVFVTIAFMAHNEGSPTYRSDLVMITRRDDTPQQAFAGYEPGKAGTARLFDELSNPSWSNRYAAHVELLRRRVPFGEARQRLEKASDHDPAYRHLLWLTGAAAGADAKVADAVGKSLARLAHAKDADLRAQAIRALSEFLPGGAVRGLVLAALADSAPQVVLAAIAGLYRYAGDLPEALVNGPARSTDTYLRQAATRLLADNASPDMLARLCSNKDAATRLAGVLAIGFRLTIPPALKPVPRELVLVPERNANEAYLVQYADARVDLRRDGPTGSYTFADLWKLIHSAPEQQRLFDLLTARLEDGDQQVRMQSAYFLSLLNDPRSEPLVAKIRRASDEKRLATAPVRGVNRVWAVGPFPDANRSFQALHPPEQGAIDLSAAYDGGPRKLTWKELPHQHHFEFTGGEAAAGHGSYYAYFRLESVRRERAQLLLGSDDAVKVWHNGREIWFNPAARGALPFQDAVMLDLQPGSNELLLRLQNQRGSCGLYLHYRAVGNVAATLPEKPNGTSLVERLKNAHGLDQKQLAQFLRIDWSTAVKQGDARRGRRLFGSLACAKCHAVNNDVSVVGGPSLAEAKKRFTVAYLVESVLLPSKQISPIFRATQIETKQGTVLTGLVVTETTDKLELLLADASRKTLAKTDVAERHVIDRSPMPEGIVKTPDELRDILGYLLSDNPMPP